MFRAIPAKTAESHQNLTARHLLGPPQVQDVSLTCQFSSSLAAHRPLHGHIARRMFSSMKCQRQAGPLYHQSVRGLIDDHWGDRPISICSRRRGAQDTAEPGSGSLTEERYTQQEKPGAAPDRPLPLKFQSSRKSPLLEISATAAHSLKAHHERSRIRMDNRSDQTVLHQSLLKSPRSRDGSHKQPSTNSCPIAGRMFLLRSCNTPLTSRQQG
jgi:hypothetical protein